LSFATSETVKKELTKKEGSLERNSARSLEKKGWVQELKKTLKRAKKKTTRQAPLVLPGSSSYILKRAKKEKLGRPTRGGEPSKGGSTKRLPKLGARKEKKGPRDKTLQEGETNGPQK